MNLQSQINRPQRPRILIFVSQFGPDAQSSGPAKSIAQLAEAMAGYADLHIVARADVRGRAPDAPIDQWHRHGGAQLFYASRSMQGLGAARRLITKVRPESLYLNSMLNLRSSIVPLAAAQTMRIGRPEIIMAPRGELSKAALKEKSWKKRPFLAMARLAGLHRNLVFQAGGESDEADIRYHYPRSPIRTALDIGELPRRVAAVRERADDRLHVLFLSRITPIKNLHLALEAVRHCSAPLHFTICGPEIDKNYALRCRQLTQQLPDNVSCSFNSEVPQHEVAGVMADHDLLFLPTGGDNFCHVVHESLSVGTPVLISDRTNWTARLDGVNSWALSLNDGSAPFTALIDRLATEAPMERVRRVAALMRDNPALKAREDAIQQTRRMLAPASLFDQPASAASPLSYR
ncbi:glycosyltransferase family 4 protein [Sphingomicrobium flavum]|uniref:glycosyltransferase family 4 protein n=1 Tax=Sphingomicrobium flavum TaxID=1229164 RepID=UPI0021AD564E|nr:glycosyltransferase family 4 protein [Sphingomicrobium flavum]